MIDKEIAKRLKERYNPDGSQLRRGQLRMIEMLKFIDSVCKDSGITYWLSFGTLLGAVRHGDFIPWDDDTDICMPIDDLEKFKNIMLHNNPSNEFVLQCRETDKGYCRSQWVVLRDLKSNYKQDNGFHKLLKYKGLQVDIFPVEYGVSLKMKNVSDFIQKRLILNPILSKKWFYKPLKPFGNILWSLLNNLFIPFCRKFFVDKKKSCFLCTSYGVDIPYTLIGSNDVIFPLTKIKFADSFFNAPKNYDAYLRNLYGDYEKVPDENSIKTHKVTIEFNE